MDATARLAVTAALVCAMGPHPTVNAEFRYEVLPPVYNSGRPPPTPVYHPPYRPTTTTSTPTLEPHPKKDILSATHIRNPLPTTTQPALPPLVASLHEPTRTQVIRRPGSLHRPSSPPKDKNALKPKTTSAHKPPRLDDAALAHNEGPGPYSFNYLVEDETSSFSHSETHDGEAASGTFRLRLPKTHQTFTYVAG
ncbi:uncharacterized protein [Panulirus ornatus]|uniref:uncharacterized protein n=1 Tax=Panulirus ornatus TaxID=150431 RepID=UPI003A8A1F46